MGEGLGDDSGDGDDFGEPLGATLDKARGDDEGVLTVEGARVIV